MFFFLMNVTEIMGINNIFNKMPQVEFLNHWPWILKTHFSIQILLIRLQTKVVKFQHLLLNKGTGAVILPAASHLIKALNKKISLSSNNLADVNYFHRYRSKCIKLKYHEDSASEKRQFLTWRKIYERR